MKLNHNLWILLACLSGGAQAEKVYTWVDDNGVAHFSQDKPKNVDAKQVKFVAPPPVKDLPPITNSKNNSTATTIISDNKSNNLISGNWITGTESIRKSTLILKPNKQFSYQSLNDPKNAVDLIGTWHYEEGFLQLKVNKKVITRRGKKSESYNNRDIDAQVLQLDNNKMNIIIEDEHLHLSRF
ncbi:MULTISPECIES: DUF4124 domain-containing protein [unclassified Motilimonas]|uniref:DUF4124 domain-containing protein n=1 Tax=Motilimonas TaxID=1914248 RepID=UPI001E4725B7|nr:MULTISPECIES: DUF4124 domain-containing protein [unclassified Motilimonas]MCE0557207.1 DUF4124 domain-containing protein [Motilimonas sp. E26]MDO6524450.1 DUF4124 domain-containing protein [Motilimonas sp. 1_MG-2023]